MKRPILALFAIALVAGLASVTHFDLLGRGFGVDLPIPCVDNDMDGFCAYEDCDDGDPTRSPNAPELCDGVDNDCDGLVDGADDVEGLCFDHSTDESRALVAYSGTATLSGNPWVVEAEGVDIKIFSSGRVKIVGDDADNAVFVRTLDGYAVIKVAGLDVAAVKTDQGALEVELNDGDDYFDAQALTTGFAGGLEVSGGPGADTLHGSDHADVLQGNRGQDTIYGYRGDDTLSGGKGADVIYGNQGDDTISGGEGDDEIHGGNGADTIYGRDAGDAGDDDDLVYGGDGWDVLFASGTLYGGAGVDLFTTGDGEDEIFGNTATDLGDEADDCDAGDAGDVVLCYGFVDGGNVTNAIISEHGVLGGNPTVFADGVSYDRRQYLGNDDGETYGSMIYYSHVRVVNRSGYAVDAFVQLSVRSSSTSDVWLATYFPENIWRTRYIADGGQETAFFTGEIESTSQTGDADDDGLRHDQLVWGFKLNAAITCNGRTHYLNDDTVHGIDDYERFWNLVVTPEACESDDWEGVFYQGSNNLDAAVTAALAE